MFDLSQLSFSALFAGIMGLSIWQSRPEKRLKGLSGSSKQQLLRYDYLKEIEHGSFNLPHVD